LGRNQLLTPHFTDIPKGNVFTSHITAEKETLLMIMIFKQTGTDEPHCYD
jgi:hypothetical protein